MVSGLRTPLTRLKRWCHLLFLFTNDYHWFKFICILCLEGFLMSFISLDAQNFLVLHSLELQTLAGRLMQWWNRAEHPRYPSSAPQPMNRTPNVWKFQGKFGRKVHTIYINYVCHKSSTHKRLKLIKVA